MYVGSPLVGSRGLWGRPCLIDGHGAQEQFTVMLRTYTKATLLRLSHNGCARTRSTQHTHYLRPHPEDYLAPKPSPPNRVGHQNSIRPPPPFLQATKLLPKRSQNGDMFQKWPHKAPEMKPAGPQSAKMSNTIQNCTHAKRLGQLWRAVLKDFWFLLDLAWATRK